MTNFNRYFLALLMSSLLTFMTLKSSKLHIREIVHGSSVHLKNYIQKLAGRIVVHNANYYEISASESKRDVEMRKLSKRTVPKSEVENKTVILMWTTYYVMPSNKVLKLILSGRQWDPECCAGDDLLVTFDKRMLANATVVVFYNFFGDLDKKTMPKKRRPDQLWVLFGKESPAYSHDLAQFPNMFNWTMTYRRDSDIWSPYGYTIPLDNPMQENLDIQMPGNVTLANFISNKSDTMIGVMSRCKSESKRESLVTALRNASLALDIYGSCGIRSICSRHNSRCDLAKVWSKIGARYKFYFAAENSICVDYITEKFWRALQMGMVPVVYGGADYTAVAPPNSYVDVRDFKSPKEVAEYLTNLAEDRVKYSKYFEWRRRHTVRLTDGWHGWCKLCRMARQYRNNADEMEINPNKSYEDLHRWWTKAGEGLKENACTPGPLFAI